MTKFKELLARADAMCVYDETGRINDWMDDLFIRQVDEIVDIIQSLATALRQTSQELEALKASNNVSIEDAMRRTGHDPSDLQN